MFCFYRTLLVFELIKNVPLDLILNLTMLCITGTGRSWSLSRRLRRHSRRQMTTKVIFYRAMSPMVLFLYRSITFCPPAGCSTLSQQLLCVSISNTSRNPVCICHRLILADLWLEHTLHQEPALSWLLTSSCGRFYHLHFCFVNPSIILTPGSFVFRRHGSFVKSVFLV